MMAAKMKGMNPRRDGTAIDSKVSLHLSSGLASEAASNNQTAKLTPEAVMLMEAHLRDVRRVLTAKAKPNAISKDKFVTHQMTPTMISHPMPS